ncbi:GL14384 [Drosophila persimilis]|uniref:non-specific serine/threonine protein kinase n=1 Tax=Drosophila persimilis TaxID=7234 RepID=B4GTM8_DROPE|nr:GL14384 [Drosophila persimilis]
MNLGDPMLRAVRVLGQGTFGRVFLCLQHEGSRQQRQVCVKRIIVRNPKTELSLIKEEIADFGISNVHAPSKQHLAGVGTPLYMAPEVMSGNGKVDYKSDIWSLGLVLYELCVGRSPFVALIDPGATPQQVHTVVVTLTRPKLDCQLIRRLHNSTWSRICELMVVYEQERRICVPDIFRLDPCITSFLYKQYFNYNYN